MEIEGLNWEKCARHQNSQTCRFVAHLFLCDGCAVKLQHECFNDRPPFYQGLSVDGYCGLCNQRQQVLLRQWFICQICLGVVLSYPKSFAASQSVHNFWESKVRPVLPRLRLDETDTVRLEPFTPGRRSQRTKAATVKTLDFSVLDDSINSETPAFFIELKAGPGSIEEMKEFQLDLNDSNDIANVCNASGVPAYIFHAQVVDEYLPPTRRSIAKGLWWSDCFTLGENLIKVAARRGEDKYAGYYRPTAFSPIATFVDALKKKSYKQLRNRLASQPLPIRQNPR